MRRTAQLPPDEYEDLRESFRPEGVGVPTRVLLIGESRPENGTFFYRGDSNLYRYTVEAFNRASRVTPAGQAFLRYFQSQGFFLIDLCERPANKLAGEIRQSMRRSGEAKIASEMKKLTKGSQLIIVMKEIKPNVQRAIVASGRADLPVALELPFPQRWPKHIEAYVNGLSEFLQPASRQSPNRPRNAIRKAARTSFSATLHEEMEAVLRRNGNQQMPSGELADGVNRRGVYKRRDGLPVPASQISARGNKYRSLFDVGTSGIRLHEFDE